MQIKGLGLIIVMIFNFQYANSQVNNPAFDLMLEGLLSHSIERVSVEEAFQMKEKVVFLDSRSKEEYEVSHLPNAHWIGYENFDLDRVDHLDIASPVIIYCSVGLRSEKIGEKLKKAGFKEIKNLYGGLFEWVNQNKPIVNEKGPTRKVHGYDKFWGVWLNEGEKVYK